MVALPVPTAHAIPNTCPTTGPDAATVNIVEPAAGTTVTGQVVVRGRASAPSGLTKVELFVGEALKDFQTFDPPRPNLDFQLRFDAGAVAAGRAPMSVVACGANQGAAIRGIASIEVQVDRGPAATAAPRPLDVVDRRPGTPDDTGPAWVGAAFGAAGLVGLIVAVRVKGARVASGPSPAAAEAARAPAASPARNGPAPPPRPSRARRKGPPGRASAPPGAAPGADAAGTASAPAEAPEAGPASPDDATRARARWRARAGSGGDGRRPARRG